MIHDPIILSHMQTIAKLRESQQELLLVLQVARSTLHAALAKEGYEWEGIDCAAIDAAIKHAKELE